MTIADHYQGSQRRQRGAATVEFALVAILFFTLLLGIVEFGRLLYLYNTIQEVTRRAAREAVVSDFNTEQGKIKRAAVFQNAGGSGTVSLPAGGEITNLVVNIEYLNDNLASASPMPTDPSDNIAACLDAGRANSCIRYVRVKICSQDAGSCNPIRYVPMIGWFSFLGVELPVSTVTMPAESLGYQV